MEKLLASIISPSSDDSSDSFALIRWLAPDGKFVLEGEPVAEVETAKASVEIPAWATGILRHIAKEGDHLTLLDADEDKFARIEPELSE